MKQENKVEQINADNQGLESIDQLDLFADELDDRMNAAAITGGISSGSSASSASSAGTSSASCACCFSSICSADTVIR